MLEGHQPHGDWGGGGSTQSAGGDIISHHLIGIGAGVLSPPPYPPPHNPQSQFSFILMDCTTRRGGPASWQSSVFGMKTCPDGPAGRCPARPPAKAPASRACDTPGLLLPRTGRAWWPQIRRLIAPDDRHPASPAYPSSHRPRRGCTEGRGRAGSGSELWPELQPARPGLSAEPSGRLGPSSRPPRAHV